MGWVRGGPLSFYRVSLVLRSTMFVNCGVLCGMRGINFESGQVVNYIAVFQDRHYQRVLIDRVLVVGLIEMPQEGI